MQSEHIVQVFLLENSTASLRPSRLQDPPAASPQPVTVHQDELHVGVRAQQAAWLRQTSSLEDGHGQHTLHANTHTHIDRLLLRSELLLICSECILADTQTVMLQCLAKLAVAGQYTDTNQYTDTECNTSGRRQQGLEGRCTCTSF